VAGLAKADDVLKHPVYFRQKKNRKQFYREMGAVRSPHPHTVSWRRRRRRREI